MSSLSRRSLLTATLAAAAAVAGQALPAAAQPRSPDYSPYLVPGCKPPGGGLPNPCPPVQPHRMTRIGVDTTYSSTPTLNRLPDGRLRLSWFNGPDHYSYGTARVMTATSSDNGGTWSAASEVPGMRQARDPSMSTVGSAVWITYFLATASQPAQGVYARRSVDGGLTFGAAVRVDSQLPYAACSAPIREIGGALWMPYYGRAAGEIRDSSFMARSTDGGATWQSERIANGTADARDYNEPWLVDGTGTPTVLHRYGGWSEIGMTRYVNGGWTQPRPLFPGTGRAATIRTSTNLLVSVYRDTQSRAAVYAVSQDNGQTWPHHGKTMLPNFATAPFGMVYASPLEIAPNRIYCPVSMEDSTTRCALWQGTLT